MQVRQQACVSFADLAGSVGCQIIVSCSASCVRTPIIAAVYYFHCSHLQRLEEVATQGALLQARPLSCDAPAQCKK